MSPSSRLWEVQDQGADVVSGEDPLGLWMAAFFLYPYMEKRGKALVSSSLYNGTNKTMGSLPPKAPPPNII